MARLRGTVLNKRLTLTSIDKSTCNSTTGGDVECTENSTKRFSD